MEEKKRKKNGNAEEKLERLGDDMKDKTTTTNIQELVRGYEVYEGGERWNQVSSR